MNPILNVYCLLSRVLICTALFISVIGFSSIVSAKIIGINPPTLPLTLQRINALPPSERTSWKEYWERSVQQGKITMAFFKAEIQQYKILKPAIPLASKRSIFWDKPAEWYASREALRIAGIIVSFQIPSGGWGKNIDLTGHLRAPGEYFSPSNKSQYLKKATNPPTLSGTFDNDATVTQLRFLAKVISSVGPAQGGPYRSSFLKGLDYIFSAQYPNGGWPQDWPLAHKYHDAITFNDNAMLNILSLLRDIAEGDKEFHFVPSEKRAIAGQRLKQGIQCVLDAQIVINGRRTVWCQQHDSLSLAPISARSYEMPSQVSSESAHMMMFLMKLPNPGPRIIASVRAAAQWFEKTKISDQGQGGIWARFYEIGTDRPIFGDPEDPAGSIHDNVKDLSQKSRDGYEWYKNTPEKVLKYYAIWSKEH